MTEPRHKRQNEIRETQLAQEIGTDPKTQTTSSKTKSKSSSSDGKKKKSLVHNIRSFVLEANEDIIIKNKEELVESLNSFLLTKVKGKSRTVSQFTKLNDTKPHKTSRSSFLSPNDGRSYYYFGLTPDFTLNINKCTTFWQGFQHGTVAPAERYLVKPAETGPIKDDEQKEVEEEEEGEASSPLPCSKTKSLTRSSRLMMNQVKTIMESMCQKWLTNASKQFEESLQNFAKTNTSLMTRLESIESFLSKFLQILVTNDDKKK